MLPIVVMQSINKTFGQIRALRNANFDLRKGEIHAIVGENGAGKTTLMRILYGMESADSGIIKVKGVKRTISSPKVAIKLGIGMVHQHPHVVPSLSVLENITLGIEPSRYGVYSQKTAVQKVNRILKKFNFVFLYPLSSRVETLPIGLQQRVGIIRSLYRGADILIFDEPTSVLTPQEVEELFSILRSLKDEGHSIIYISHKLPEVLEISDRITVLRHGVVQGEVSREEADVPLLTHLMIGHDLPIIKRKGPVGQASVALRIERMTVLDDLGLPAVKEVTLSVHSGEILGIAGVEGNGQREFAEAIAGVRPLKKGHILLKGIDITNYSVSDRYKLGLTYIPPQREFEGSIRDFTIAENLIPTRVSSPPISKFGVLQRKEIIKFSELLIEQYNIDGKVHTKAGNLSGGNLQKILIARALQGSPKVILAYTPTRGVDVGAIHFIHTELLRQREEGCAIILISNDLDEIFAISDRIVTFYEGQVTGDLPITKADREHVGSLMLGKGE